MKQCNDLTKTRNCWRWHSWEKTGIISTKFSFRCTPSVILGLHLYMKYFLLSLFRVLLWRINRYIDSLVHGFHFFIENIFAILKQGATLVLFFPVLLAEGMCSLKLCCVWLKGENFWSMGKLLLPFCFVRKKCIFFVEWLILELHFVIWLKESDIFFNRPKKGWISFVEKRCWNLLVSCFFFCENSLMSSIFVQSRQFVGGLNPWLLERGDRGPPYFDR